MNVVIVAGGLGTRYEDLSVFPKVLLPTRHYSSVLEQMIKVFGYGSTLSLIINSKFYDMCRNYCDVNGLSVNIIESKNSNGSYNTIKSVIDDIPNEDVLFVWSDLEIVDATFTKRLNEDTIITCNGEYRYFLEWDGYIKPSEGKRGNIPGIYYLKSLSEVFSVELDAYDNFDIVDRFIQLDKPIKALDVSNNVYVTTKKTLQVAIVEYRDKQSYIDWMKSTEEVHNKTRFFNKIERCGNKMLWKHAIVESYKPLVEKEYLWYQTIEKIVNKKITPKIYKKYDGGGFIMEDLSDNYVTLHHYLTKCNPTDEDVIHVYDSIFRNLSYFDEHKKSVYSKDIYDDLKEEILDKVIRRCENIKHMLINYDKDELERVLAETLKYCSDEVINGRNEAEYVLCHGDLNGSNIMVNPNTKNAMFIDPRGYFGFTKMYGPKCYEMAKLLYALNGYDDFNKKVQIYNQDTPQELPYISKISQLDRKLYKVLVGVIWIALAGYISQDIMKANIAYEHGMKKLKEAL